MSEITKNAELYMHCLIFTGILKKVTYDKSIGHDFCSLCNGTGNNRCTNSDPYAGNERAFICMAEGNMDRVAFVKQDTAANVFAKYPGKYGDEDDYELLCPNDERKGIFEVKM